MPDQLLLPAERVWLQPQFFTAPLLSFHGDRAYAQFGVDLSDDEQRLLVGTPTTVTSGPSRTDRICTGAELPDRRKSSVTRPAVVGSGRTTEWTCAFSITPRLTRCS